MVLLPGESACDDRLEPAVLADFLVPGKTFLSLDGKKGQERALMADNVGRLGNLEGLPLTFTWGVC